MAGALIRCRLENGAFVPLGPHQARRTAEQFCEGELLELEVRHERARASHNHEFAWLAEGWRSLPESVEREWWAQSPETLRAYALIMTRQCDVYPVVASSKASARALVGALAVLLRDRFGKHVMIVHEGRSATVLVPWSQSCRAMGRKEFERSKALLLDYVAGLLGVTPEELGRVQPAA